MKSFTPHLQRQPRLQGLVSTVLVDSPHGDHSLAVHTVTALAKHAQFLAASPVVLAFDGATVVPTRPSVGIDEFGMHFGSACAKSDANETHYASYKQHIMEHARRVLAMPVLVEASERRCIAGVIRLALETTHTEYVLVMQYDQPFVRDIDTEALLRLMSRNVDAVKAVWLDTGVNQCTAANAWTACGRNRPWSNPRSPSISLGTLHGTNASMHEETLYAVQQWTDGVHVSRRDFYIEHVFPTVLRGMEAERSVGRKPDETLRRQPSFVHGAGGKQLRHPIPWMGGFVEWYAVCEPWRNHSFWGTWMLGGPFSGYWTEHRASKTHSNPTCYNPAQCACEGKILRQRNDTRTLRASVHS